MIVVVAELRLQHVLFEPVEELAGVIAAQAFDLRRCDPPSP